MKNTSEAFKWIVKILCNHSVPFQITGGLAARIYGSPRELTDIDIDIPDERFWEILPEVKEYIIFGPERYKDEQWDILLLTLKYHEQNIDLSGADSIKLFDFHAKTWFVPPHDFSKYETKEIFGFSVPVITKEDLIFYKSKIFRECDQIDLEAMKIGVK
jgi:predicted nucleotidyltransferase